MKKNIILILSFLSSIHLEASQVGRLRHLPSAIRSTRALCTKACGTLLTPGDKNNYKHSIFNDYIGMEGSLFHDYNVDKEHHYFTFLNPEQQRGNGGCNFKITVPLNEWNTIISETKKWLNEKESNLELHRQLYNAFIKAQDKDRKEFTLKSLVLHMESDSYPKSIMTHLGLNLEDSILPVQFYIIMLFVEMAHLKNLTTTTPTQPFNLTRLFTFLI